MGLLSCQLCGSLIRSLGFVFTSPLLRSCGPKTPPPLIPGRCRAEELWTHRRLRRSAQAAFTRRSPSHVTTIPTRPLNVRLLSHPTTQSTLKPVHITESRTAATPPPPAPATLQAPAPGVVAGFPRFVKSNFLYRNSRRFLHDDTLTIRCVHGCICALCVRVWNEH